MTFPATDRQIDVLSGGGGRWAEGVGAFSSACALGLIAPLLLFTNDLSRPSRLGELMAFYFTGRLAVQWGARRRIREGKTVRLEIAAHLIAVASYLYLAVANLNGSARWAQLLVLSFIIGMSGAMAIAPCTDADAALSTQHEASGRTTGLGFAAGWLLAAALFALAVGALRPVPLWLLDWLAPIAAVLELYCVVLILSRSTRKIPVIRHARAVDRPDIASYIAVLGYSMASTSAAFVAWECALLTPAMMSALIGALAIVVMIVMRLAGGRSDRVRSIAGPGLAIVGIIGLVAVYHTSSRLLCVTTTTLIAIGMGLFLGNRPASQTPRINTLAWIVGPLISSCLYYDHLRTSVLLPALVITAAVVINLRTKYRQRIVAQTVAPCGADV